MSLTKNLLSFEVPIIVEAKDYHEFHDMQRFMRQTLGLKTAMADEIGFCKPTYIGLIYDERSPPTRAEVDSMLERLHLKPTRLQWPIE